MIRDVKQRKQMVGLTERGCEFWASQLLALEVGRALVVEIVLASQVQVATCKSITVLVRRGKKETTGAMAFVPSIVTIT